jgi:hypothetical protein
VAIGIRARTEGDAFPIDGRSEGRCILRIAVEKASKWSCLDAEIMKLLSARFDDADCAVGLSK